MEIGKSSPEMEYIVRFRLGRLAKTYCEQNKEIIFEYIKNDVINSVKHLFDYEQSMKIEDFDFNGIENSDVFFVTIKIKCIGGETGLLLVPISFTEIELYKRIKGV